MPWGRIQRKTWCMGLWGPMPELTITSLQSRLQHIYHGQPYAMVDLNPMPEFDFILPSGSLDLASEMRNVQPWPKGIFLLNCFATKKSSHPWLFCLQKRSIQPWLFCLEKRSVHPWLLCLQKRSVHPFVLLREKVDSALTLLLREMEYSSLTILLREKDY